MTFGRLRKWASGPVIGGVAAGVLVAAVALGIHIPGLGFLSPFGDGAALDYSSIVAHEFPPLLPRFRSEVLGAVIPDPSKGAGRSHDTQGGNEGGVIVRHGLTNDNRANAYRIPAIPFTAESDTSRATRESSEPSDCSPVGGTVWYRFTAPLGQGLLASTDGSRYATALGVFAQDESGALRNIGCSTNAQGSSSLTFAAIAAETYFFQVTGPLNGGPLVLSLRAKPATVLASAGSFQDIGATRPALSGDGRWVAFDGDSPALTHCDSCGGQTYIRDLATRRVELVSVSSSGKPGNCGCFGGFEGEPSVSKDGRFVAFGSFSTNLVPGDTNNHMDVFVRDRLLHKTERVSMRPNGRQSTADSFRPIISDDGRYVAFWSRDDNLEAGKTAWGESVYRYDRLTHRTQLAAVSSDGAPANETAPIPGMSSDGRYVTFESSATNLTSDTNPVADVLQKYDETRQSYPPAVPAYVRYQGVGYAQMYRHDFVTGRTDLVCRANDGTPANTGCYGGGISRDGRFIVYLSTATNLAAPLVISPAKAGFYQVYVEDMTKHTVELASISSSGTVGGDTAGFGDFPVLRDTGVDDPRRPRQDHSLYVGMSDDGRYVAFDSAAPDLDPTDTNGVMDVFVHDRETGLTRCMSLTSDGAHGDKVSQMPVLSHDGRTVAFVSMSRLSPDDGNQTSDIYLRT